MLTARVWMVLIGVIGEGLQVWGVYGDPLAAHRGVAAVHAQRANLSWTYEEVSLPWVDHAVLMGGGPEPGMWAGFVEERWRSDFRTVLLVRFDAPKELEKPTESVEKEIS